MVSFTSQDIQIMLGLFVGILILNQFTAAAGLADVGTNGTDAPTLNITENRFDFANDPPLKPLGPDEFRIDNGTKFSVIHDLNASTSVIAGSGSPNTIWSADLFHGGVSQDKVEFTENGESGVLEYHEWRVFVEMEDMENGQIRGDVQRSPGGSTGFIEKFLGDTAEAVGGVFRSIVYLAALIGWPIAQLIQAFANMVGLVFDIAKFLIAFVVYQFVAYGNIVTAASGWAVGFVSVPLLALSFYSAKLGLSLVSSSDWL